MSAYTPPGRLDDEGSPLDEQDTEGHRLSSNDDETVVADEQDTEGHRLASNDDETVVAEGDDAG